jgi:hypothetical protein
MKTLRTVKLAPWMALCLVACGHHAVATPAPSAAEKPPAREAALAPCSLISAAEVGAIVGKPIVSQANGEGCEYSLDPSAPQPTPQAAAPHAKAGGVPDLMSALGQGGDFAKIAGGVANQLLLTLTAARDGMSEAKVRSLYERTGETVRGVTQPESRGLGQVIRAGDDIPGVADWAFAVNIAAVNMGFGFSTRGRILEAGRGPWRLTLTVNVSPDPGPEKLDRQLAAVAHAAAAKLPS